MRRLNQRRISVELCDITRRIIRSVELNTTRRTKQFRRRTSVE